MWRRSAFLLIALLGLALRLPQLGARPMHTDEAVNAYIVGQALAGHGFTYDAKDRHGPALVALAWPLARLQGAKTFATLTESELRLTDVLAGTTTILLFGAAAEMFGFAPCLIAALLFAVAPLPVYYDRYFIHESLFVAATFGLILTGWRAWKRSSPGQGILCGICAALMFACKETAILHLVAIAAAAICFSFRNLRGGSVHMARRKNVLVATTAAFLALTALLLLWLGSSQNIRVELPHLTSNLLARAVGEGHEKAFSYYAQLLTHDWSGRILSAMAGIGCLQIVRRREHAPFALMGCYALFLAAIYSLIPYKTPWLALNLWLPIALFAGLGATTLWNVRPAGPTVSVLIAVAVGITVAHDTRLRVFRFPFDESNPYAYAHTSDDLLGLLPAIEQIAREQSIAIPRIAVIAADPWPLPWYLRHFPQTGFWQPNQHVDDADFYITSADAAGQTSDLYQASDLYKDRLRNFHPDYFGVRPGVLILLWSPLPK